ncbi:MAG TPA: site-specific integrase [Sphingobium sp.]|uniref:tyrosine-type recombinase/integrase n=1 Tax=Sphingobium sp. TaxID=1912891 RepID=UPI002ED48B7F
MPKNLYVRNDVYWARFKIAGRSYRKSLHVRVEPAKRAEAKAVRALERLRSQIEDEVRHGIAPPLLWQEAVIAWNEVALRSIAENSHRRYLVSLNQCRLWLDGKQVRDINGACLRDLIKARRSQGVSNATIRRDLTAISAVLSIAQDEGWVEENHASTINRKRIPERRDPISLPTDESIAEMLAVLPPTIGEMCAFALETGMRQNEIVCLDWRCINGNRTIATLTKTKGSKLRAVPLSEKARMILQRQPRSQHSKLVFWREDGLPMDWVSSQFGAAARKVAQSKKDFVRFRFHDLRHLFAVRYLQDGGSIYALQGLLGHTSIKTTEIYLAYLTPDQQQGARLGAAQKGSQHQRFDNLTEDNHA